jgi:hypothetical protein
MTPATYENQEEPMLFRGAVAPIPSARQPNTPQRGSRCRQQISLRLDFLNALQIAVHSGSQEPSTGGPPTRSAASLRLTLGSATSGHHVPSEKSSPNQTPAAHPYQILWFYYSDSLINVDISQRLRSPAWPLDFQGAYASCLT